MIRVAHVVPGRVRIAIVELYRGELAAPDPSSPHLAAVGVTEVRINVLTGSAVLRHEEIASPAEIAKALATTLGIALRTIDDRRGPESSPGAPPLTSLIVNLKAVAEAIRWRGRKTPGAETIQAARPVGDHPWHAMSIAEIFDLLETGESGLDPLEADQRLVRIGANVLPEAETRSALQMVSKQFANLPVGLLSTSAVVSALTGGAVDAAAILVVIGINAAIGYITESQSERTIRMLGTRIPETVTARRDGESVRVPVPEIVPGDVIELHPGDYVPADARIAECRNLSVDESSLTGESVPARKSAEPVGAAETPLADRASMIYMGTVVTGGSGSAVVVGTGTGTEMGAIQQLAESAERPQTPVEKQLDQLGSRLALISGAACVVVFGVGLVRGSTWMEMLKASISLGAAAVPEGLPAVATTTLALGIRNMQKRKALIRRLDAVEALGSVQTICLDKTGTLTVNRMTTSALHVDDRDIRVEDGAFYSSDGEIDIRRDPTARRLFELLALCNELEPGLHESGDDVRLSPTEAALEAVARNGGVDPARLRLNRPKLWIRHRAENRPYLATLHEGPRGRPLLAVKGAPGRVLDLCGWRIRNGRRTRLGAAERDRLKSRNDDLAGAGLRMLGVAYANRDPGNDDTFEDLTWVGLAGLMDPTRPGMRDLLGQFHDAGIDTVMITGDQGPTALAIARQLNLSNRESVEMLDSIAVDRMDPELLAGMLRRVSVFSRFSPAHKLYIVQALQRSGRVVAMTGDGINDGPALKASDLGIAMGGDGSEIARNIADVVLEDDNLHTLVEAIAQGRTIYQNIRKSVRFLLATNMSELSVMTLSIALGLGQPLNPLQLLWINLITDIFPAIALGLDPPEPDILDRPPRSPDDPIIRGADFKRLAAESVAMTAGTMGSYLYGRWRYGPGPEAQTQAFMSLTYNQLLHCLGSRSEHAGVLDQWRASQNPQLLAASAISSLVQVLTMLPPLRGLLGTARLGPGDFLVSLAGAVLPFVVNELTRSSALIVSTADTTDKTRGNEP